MKTLTLSLVLLCVIFFARNTFADLPVHCMPDGTPGEWTFDLTEQNYTNEVVHTCKLRDCVVVHKSIKLSLSAPNVAKDENGNVGVWTNIYDQGFEVAIAGNKYYAFFSYEEQAGKVISHCNQTFTGWYHEAAVAPKKWGCYRGRKAESATTIYYKSEDELDTFDGQTVEDINNQQTLWTATEYKQVIPAVVPIRRFKPFMNARVKKSDSFFVSDAPKELDWRNMTGVNYVSPVRNQAACGSCFSFASTAMVEAAVRIATKNQQKPVFAPQEIVSCSTYSQGCNGGFPMLVFKWGEDIGLREESCYPYEGRDAQCTGDRCMGAPRQFVTNYQYVGGVIGAATEQLMIEALQKGPIVLNFIVYADFTRYKKGVYVRTSNVVRGGHSVLGVGYGEENGVRYWIVKNSWGDSWGESGYFRIRRGTDECGIESMGPSSATPVL